jgi:hypothetical protein
MIMCQSQKDLPEKTMLLDKIGIPIYVFEESRIIDNEMVGDSLVDPLPYYA